MALNGKKSVLITGCTPGGIGHALALQFHAKGYHVIATARKVEVLDDMTKMGMSAVALDVTSAESIKECTTQVGEITGGTLDILVNNAGLIYMLPAADIDMDGVKAAFDTNVFGVMAMCKAFIPFLIASRGLILNISSISSITPDLYASVYSATKGAINSYSRTMRLELRPFNVRVMVAMTGTVKSNIATKITQHLPLDSIYQPVNDIYEARHNFSQETIPMDTDTYASKIVCQAIKGEGWMGGWFGRSPDWYWTGGIARRTWVGSLLPTRWSENLVALVSDNDTITKKIEAAKLKAVE